MGLQLGRILSDGQTHRNEESESMTGNGRLKIVVLLAVYILSAFDRNIQNCVGLNT